MFDWVKKLLFEEEDIVVEENKLEEIDFTKVNDLENIITDNPKKEVVEKVEKQQVEEVVVQEEKVNTIPIKKEFNIQLTEISTTQPKEEVVVEHRSRRVERTTSNTKENNVEITNVISPMFGGKEVKKTEQKVNYIAVPKKKDGLGIVISPMYGQKELSEHQEEAKIKIEENKNKNIPLVEDDDWKNDIPLDELISSEEETNDCVQFSLFGDDQTINE